jgi:hypothetical protein
MSVLEWETTPHTTEPSGGIVDVIHLSYRPLSRYLAHGTFPKHIGLLVLTVVAIMRLLSNLDSGPHDVFGHHKHSRG